MRRLWRRFLEQRLLINLPAQPSGHPAPTILAEVSVYLFDVTIRNSFYLPRMLFLCQGQKTPKYSSVIRVQETVDT